MIIDFHAHCFHDYVADKARVVLEKNCGCPAKIGFRLGDLLHAMQTGPVDMSVVVNIATNVKQTDRVNDFALSLLDKKNLVPFGSIHPYDENFMLQLERLAEAGIKGIKYHPHYQGVYINDPRIVTQIRAALDMGLIVTLHCGVDVGLTEPNYATPQATAEMLDAVGDPHKGAIVLAHMGGYQEFDNVEKYLVGRDVYFDTAYIYEKHPICIEDEQAVRIVKNHGAERILFATDSPWVDVPDYVQRVNNWDLTSAEKAMIFSENARALLKL